MPLSFELNQQLDNVRRFIDHKDVQRVAAHMQKARNIKITPGDVSQRGLKFADELVLASYGEFHVLVRMELAVNIVEEAMQLVIQPEKKKKEE